MDGLRVEGEVWSEAGGFRVYRGGSAGKAPGEEGAGEK